MRGLLLTCLVLALIATALVDAKKAKGKEKKAEKTVKETKTKEWKTEKNQPKKKVKEAKPEEELAKKDAVEEIPAELDEVVPEQCSKTVHHHACNGGTPEPIYRRPYISKPKNVKTLTEYEQCKMECKRKRDEASVVQYVEQLRAELAQAEAALLEQQAQEAAKTQAEQQPQETTAQADKPVV